MEFGPYVYREWDKYDELEYTGLSNVISKDETLPSVYAKFSQGADFDSDGDGHIDTKMFMTNQAAYGVWYQQNSMIQPENQWRVYLNLLYTVVVDGLGKTVVQQGVWAEN